MSTLEAAESLPPFGHGPVCTSVRRFLIEVAARVFTGVCFRRGVQCEAVPSHTACVVCVGLVFIVVSSCRRFCDVEEPAVRVDEA